MSTSAERMRIKRTRERVLKATSFRADQGLLVHDQAQVKLEVGDGWVRFTAGETAQWREELGFLLANNFHTRGLVRLLPAEQGEGVSPPA